MTVSAVDVPESGKLTKKPGKIAIQITNDKNIQPLKPIRITMHYRLQDVPGLLEEKLAICRYVGINKVYDIETLWTPLPSTVDADAGVVTATTDHLSTFVLAQPAPAADLSGIKVYPNPLHSNLNTLKIDGLTAPIYNYSLLPVN